MQELQLILAWDKRSKSKFLTLKIVYIMKFEFT